VNQQRGFLDEEGLRQFNALRGDAVDSVTARFYKEHLQLYASFGARGREACREDLAFHLDFLRPVLEFGEVQPMVDYLHWLSQVLESRGVPSQHLVQSLEWLAAFFEGQAQPKVGPAIHQALLAVRAGFLASEPGTGGIDALMPPAWPESELFQAALLAGDRAGARALVSQCLTGERGLLDVELHLVQPALYGIGRQWQANQVSVAQEHLATALSSALMNDSLLREIPAAPIGKRVLLACVEGNQHCVGLQMVADAFLLDGWEVQYLGASVPAGALLSQVASFRPDIVCLSVSFAHQLGKVKEVLRRLDAAEGATRPPVLVGGLAINQFEALAGQLGADAWSPDARAAVGQARRLLKLPEAG